MIDLFLCTIKRKGAIRHAMADLCISRWAQEDGVRVHVITPEMIECSPEQFQRERRIYADTHADSSIYIVADDDCFLTKDFSLGEVRLLMDLYPDFGILSLMPQNATIGEWTPEDYKTKTDGVVMEHVSVGGVRFCRKGLMKDWPSQRGKGYDLEQCEQVRKQGGRVGYMRSLKMLHLGEGYSTVW